MGNSQIEAAGKILTKLGFKEKSSDASGCFYVNDEVGVLYQNRKYRLVHADSRDDISPHPHSTLRDLLHEAGILGYIEQSVYVGIRI